MIAVWDSVSCALDVVTSLRCTWRALDRDGRPVIAAFYTQCSQLTFALSRPEDPPVRCASPLTDDFDLWDGLFDLPENGAFFVTGNRFDHDLGHLFPGASKGPPLVLEITRAGRWVRRFEMVLLEAP